MTDRRERRARATAAALDPRPDDVLTAAAAHGDRGAFEELYRRHAAVAWRVAFAIAANPADAADAVSDAFTRVLAALGGGRLPDGTLFRSYLMTATRNAAIDLHRRGRRVETTAHLDDLAGPTPGPTPAEGVVRGEDASRVAEAFRSLPERWRSVLWMMEVERIPAREAAGLLGLTPNGLAQLAFRARAGLRERFVQAHLRQPIAGDCKFCVEHLGAYVMGTLPARTLVKVDEHLAACPECKGRAEQLGDLGRSLRRIALPLPLALGAASMAKWKVALAATPAAPPAAATAGGSWSGELLAKVQRPLLAASVGMFALGVISASVLGGPLDPNGRRGSRTPFAAARPTGPEIVEEQVVLTSGVGLADGGAAPGSALELAAGEPGTDALDLSAPPPSTGTAPGPDPAAPPGTDGSDGRGGTPPAPPEPLLNAGTGAAVAGAPVAVAAGYGAGSCTGITVIAVAAGCSPPKSDAPVAGVIVTTDGSAGGGLLNNNSLAVGL